MVDHTRHGGTAADEDRRRARELIERGRRLAGVDDQLRDAQPLGVGRDAGGTGRVALDRDRPHAATRSQPLDGDTAGPGADVPEQLAVAGGQSRQGDRPDFGLGELAVMGEGVVGQPRDGRQRPPARVGDQFDRHAD